MSPFRNAVARAARRPTLVLVALVALITGACGPQAGSAAPDTAAPVAPSSSASPVVTGTPPAFPAATAAAFPLTLVDDEGTELVLPAEPQRIVSLTPAETEILFALGVGDRVVGKVEDIANYPPEAESVPVMGRFDGVDVEQILAAGTDLVIAGGSGGTPAEAIDHLRSLSVPVLVVYAEDVDGVFDDIELTAAAVGRPAEGAALVEEMRATFDAVAEATADLPRPRVFLETGDAPSIYGIADDSVYAQMIELAGGTPVTTGSATSWEMSIERLVTEDPEIILLADAAYGVTPEAVAGRTGWGTITAVRDGAIRPIDDITVTRPGPRLTEGLLELVSAIHPDVDVEALRRGAGSDG